MLRKILKISLLCLLSTCAVIHNKHRSHHGVSIELPTQLDTHNYAAIHYATIKVTNNHIHGKIHVQFDKDFTVTLHHSEQSSIIRAVTIDTKSLHSVQAGHHINFQYIYTTPLEGSYELDIKGKIFIYDAHENITKEVIVDHTTHFVADSSNFIHTQHSTKTNASHYAAYQSSNHKYHIFDASIVGGDLLINKDGQPYYNENTLNTNDRILLIKIVNGKIILLFSSPHTDSYSLIGELFDIDKDTVTKPIYKFNYSYPNSVNDINTIVATDFFHGEYHIVYYIYDDSNQGHIGYFSYKEPDFSTPQSEAIINTSVVVNDIKLLYPVDSVEDSGKEYFIANTSEQSYLYQYNGTSIVVMGDTNPVALPIHAYYGTYVKETNNTKLRLVGEYQHKIIFMTLFGDISAFTENSYTVSNIANGNVIDNAYFSKVEPNDSDGKNHVLKKLSGNGTDSDVTHEHYHYYRVLVLGHSESNAFISKSFIDSTNPSHLMSNFSYYEGNLLSSFQGFINIDNIQGNYHILGKLNDDLLVTEISYSL